MEEGVKNVVAEADTELGNGAVSQAEEGCNFLQGILQQIRMRFYLRVYLLYPP